jgi:hypothetical protein
VREHRFAHCDTPALALCLILVTVADAQGLSYSSTASLARLTHLTPEQDLTKTGWTDPKEAQLQFPLSSLPSLPSVRGTETNEENGGLSWRK